MNEPFVVPENLTDKEFKLLDTLRVNVIEANSLKEKTRGKPESEDRMKERKLRFTASNFGKIVRRQRHHEKFVQDLLAQKPISTTSMEHGKKI